MPTTDYVGITGEPQADRKAIVKALARWLDVHDAEHTGAWGKPDDRCPFC